MENEICTIKVTNPHEIPTISNSLKSTGGRLPKGTRHGRLLTPGFTPLKLKLKLVANPAYFGFGREAFRDNEGYLPHRSFG